MSNACTACAVSAHFDQGARRGSRGRGGREGRCLAVRCGASHQHVPRRPVPSRNGSGATCRDLGQISQRSQRLERGHVQKPRKLEASLGHGEPGRVLRMFFCLTLSRQSWGHRVRVLRKTAKWCRSEFMRSFLRQGNPLIRHRSTAPCQNSARAWHGLHRQHQLELIPFGCGSQRSRPDQTRRCSCSKLAATWASWRRQGWVRQSELCPGELCPSKGIRDMSCVWHVSHREAALLQQQADTMRLRKLA